MATYSFLNVQAAISGPGGGFSLGSDAGAAEEGIDIEFVDDKNTMTIGAGGQGQHNLHASKAGTVTVKLLKTSPVNKLLQQLYSYQTTSAAYHGQNVITLRDVVRGDVYTCQQGAFKKFPKNTFAKDGPTMEWGFDFILIDPLLGDGNPAAS